jgi:hypothetical protein
MFTLICLLILHFVADFLLQSREMGQKKSSEWRWLLKHLAIQFGVFFLIVPLLKANEMCIYGEQNFPEYMNTSDFIVRFLIQLPLSVGFVFSLFNTLIHGLIDWNIWKAYKLYAYYKIKATAKRNQGCDPSEEAIAMYARDFKYWEDHWFYTTIGFDQLLHTSTIIVLYFWLF